MSELIWLNGTVGPLAEAHVGVEDRGFQFADGVYEVIRLYNGRCFALDEHLVRLERSCAGIMLPMPMPREQLAVEVRNLVEQSALVDGMVYLQATRGCHQRNHIFQECEPTLLFYTRALPPMPPAGGGEGVRLLSVADERWKRCWVKSIALLANVLAKNTAVAAGADEAVFVEDGWVTECSASNIFIVRSGMLLTHPVGPKVLPGITRDILLELAKEMGIPALERPFSEAEAMSAEELFITSTTREISWVSHWNDRPARNETAGPVTRRLAEAIRRRATAT